MGKDGPASSIEISPEMQRRLLQNVVAIEKDLNLVPTVSVQIGTIHEDLSECELSDTNKTRKEPSNKTASQKNQLFSGENESPDFPKRSSSDIVNVAHQKKQISQRQLISETEEVDMKKDQRSSEEEFESCYLDYANPFGTNADGNGSRQYIDDMTSSSGDIPGL